ncbi:signal recognition particle-docking protein FtsY [Candidatus Woesearchaeota archaeon]|nr:signal recognition particle-docking protein FtsY [Candidatus Woesearchaeota archaeon]
MFKFLKNKIKDAVKNISKNVEEKEQEETTEIIKEEKPIKEEKTIIEKETKEKIEKIIEEKPKKSLASKIKEKITTKRISEKEFEELFWELELALLENNVAVEVIEKIKQELKVDLVDNPLEKNKIEDIIENSLKETIKDLFKEPDFNLIEKIKESEKPYVILLLGVNGSGKTTTVAKLTKLLQTNKLSVTLAAADTFRAAAIDQIQSWADKLDVKLIKHDYGADAAAVAFDAVKHAKAKKIDVVLIDTAGRMHSNINLRDELKKIVRIAKPDLKIFVGESITGNDCIEQATTFNEAVEIDGIILSKADIDEKGGTAISISHVTDKPILYLGTGQELKDIEKFNVSKLIENLGW